jgi:[protein-PII] uridylyltransferase
MVSLLGAKKLSIHDAKVTTSKTGYTANTFVVLDNHHKAINDSGRAKQLARSLSQALSKDKCKIKVKPLAKRYQQFKIKTQVNFIESVTKKGTMLEIVALDRPGLLAKFAMIFQKCNLQIHSAKITTFGEKAEDVFTVSNSSNEALTQEQQDALETMLCADSPH